MLTEQILDGLDKCYAQNPKNLDGMALQMRHLRRLMSAKSCTESFPQEIIFKTKAHIIILKNLDPEINEGHQLLIQETIWCLSNICLSNPSRLRNLLDLKILELVKQYLTISDQVIVESTFWMLANMLSDFPQAKVDIISNGYLDFILDHLDVIKGSNKLSGIVAWFLSNFFKGRPSVSPKLARPLLTNMTFLLDFPVNSDIVEETIWCYSFYLDNKDPDYRFINNLEIIPKLKSVFLSDQCKILAPIVRIFGKLSLGDSQIVQNFLDESFKESLLNKLCFGEVWLSKDVLWTLSNLILTGTNEMELLYDSRVLSLIRDLILDANIPPVLKCSALGVFQSFFNQLGFSERENLIFKHGFVDCILTCIETSEKENISIAIRCLEEILKFGVVTNNAK